MRQQAMRYKDFTWPYNPANLEISRRRSVGEFVLPRAGELLQDLGMQKRVVSGEGEFFGPDAAATFERLTAVFETGGAGVLALPGTAPFSAVFRELVELREPRPELISYRFVFWEAPALPAGTGREKESHPELYYARAGESLWEIAARCGEEADVLLALNRHIQWPGALEAGERVILP